MNLRVVKLKNEQYILEICESSFKILSLYYHFESIPNFHNFLLSPSQELGLGGQVLLQENVENNEIYIGLQFGSDLYFKTESNGELTLQKLTVITEETSHLKLIIDACTLETALTPLKLEMFGEIDRFLILMHWNHYVQKNKLQLNWKNLHEICDHTFAGNRFKGALEPLYIDAEALAFKHLKKAFANSWDNSYYDFSKVDKTAQCYLMQLRRHVLGIKCNDKFQNIA